MNKKIDLSSLKENEGALVAAAMVILAVILGVAVFFTVKLTKSVQSSIDAGVANAQLNVQRIENLRSIKANQQQFANEVSKYNELIAEAGTYDKLDRQIELEDMLSRYGLEGEVTTSDLESFASVQKAESTVTNIVGNECDIKAMCKEILSPKYVVRIDGFSMADNGDGTVTAEFTVVDFTK